MIVCETMQLSDSELLERYARHKSETAFAELVERHIDLVYGTASRVTGGDRPLSQEVVQDVFTDLARKASSLARYETLAGWLHTSTRFAAAKAVRSRQRRQLREQQAAPMPDLNPAIEPDWSRIQPLLDEAIGTLNEKDRTAILLRFLERRSFAEVGRALGLSDNAARMRIERTLEKLRLALNRQGLTTTTVGLAAVLSGPAILTAPAGLAAAATGAAVAAGAPASISGIFGFMTSTSLKYGAAALLALAGGSVPVWKLSQHNHQLSAELQQQAAQLNQLEAERQRLAQLLDEAAKNKAKQANDFKELLRLRSEVSSLREQISSKGNTNTPSSFSADQEAAVPPAAVHAYLPKGQTLLMGGEAVHPGKRLLAFVSPEFGTESVGSNQVMVTMRLAEIPEGALKTLGLGSWMSAADGAQPPGGYLSREQMQSVLRALEQIGEASIVSGPNILTHSGVQAQVSMTGPQALPQASVSMPLSESHEPIDSPTPSSTSSNQGQSSTTGGLTLDLMPVLAPDGSGIDLTVVLQVEKPKSD